MTRDAKLEFHVESPDSTQEAIRCDSAPLRVLVVSTSYPLSDQIHFGIFVRRICEALQGADAEVTVVSPSDVDHDPKFDDACPVRMRRARYFWKRGEVFFNRPPGGLPQRFKRFSFAWFLAPSALASLSWETFWAAKRSDIIHCHWFPTAIFGWLPAIVWRKPLVITVHGSDASKLAKTRPGKMLMQILFRRAAQIVSVNEGFVTWLQQTFPEFADKASFLPNGISIQQGERVEPKASDRLRLLFVGNIVRDKGVHELCSSFDRLVAENADIELTLIGHSPHEGGQWFTDWLAKHPDRLRYLGMQPQETVLQEMAIHDLFVLPTYREGRCSVIMEAMAANLPILTTSIPSMFEMLDHQRDAYLIEPQDAAALYYGLRWCLEHRPQLGSMAQSAAERIAREGLTWEACAQRHIALYREILDLPVASNSPIEVVREAA